MITPFAVAILFALFAWPDIFNSRMMRDPSFLDYCGASLILLFVSFLAFLVGFGVALLIGLMIPKRKVKVSDAPLVSLRDAEGISGDFFLGSGHFESKWYYFYYTKFGESYIPHQLSVHDNSIEVIEQERGDGRVIQYEYNFVHPGFDLVAIYGGGFSYQFIIPVASLKKGFALR